MNFRIFALLRKISTRLTVQGYAGVYFELYCTEYGHMGQAGVVEVEVSVAISMDPLRTEWKPRFEAVASPYQ
jgi:hypothetical protein